MRIAIFSDNFYPELSGIADSVVVLAKELANSGHQVRFYAPRYSVANFKTANLPAAEFSGGPNISVHRFFSLPFPAPTHQGRLVIPWPGVSSDVKKFGPDVIHSQLFFGTGLNALLAARKLKIPLVGTNHTAIKEFLRYTPIKSEGLKNLLLKYVVWYYNQCKFVTAPSQSVFTEMKEYGFAAPHDVVSNPIDIVTFTPAVPVRKADLKKEFGFSEHTIFYAGRLAPEKDIDVIINALAEVRREVPDVMLALAGHGASLEVLKKQVADLKLEANVKFLGTLNKKKLAEVYQASDIFTIMSTSETQSLTLMQAMASRIPVIGARARALPEYINSENGFLVEPGDAKTLAETLVKLLADDSLRSRLGQGGRVFSEQFSPENIARKWLSIYADASGDVHSRNSRTVV